MRTAAEAAAIYLNKYALNTLRFRMQRGWYLDW